MTTVITIAEKGNIRETWEEKYELEFDSVNMAEQWASELIDNYNEGLKSGEKPRRLINVDIGRSKDITVIRRGNYPMSLVNTCDILDRECEQLRNLLLHKNEQVMALQTLVVHMRDRDKTWYYQHDGYDSLSSLVHDHNVCIPVYILRDILINGEIMPDGERKLWQKRQE